VAAWRARDVVGYVMTNRIFNLEGCGAGAAAILGGRRFSPADDVGLVEE